jgi:hypothetical protein
MGTARVSAAGSLAGAIPEAVPIVTPKARVVLAQEQNATRGWSADRRDCPATPRKGHTGAGTARVVTRKGNLGRLECLCPGWPL